MAKMLIIAPAIANIGVVDGVVDAVGALVECTASLTDRDELFLLSPFIGAGVDGGDTLQKQYMAILKEMMPIIANIITIGRNT